MKTEIALLLVNVLSIAFANDEVTVVLKPNVRELLVKEGGTQELHCYANTSATNRNPLEWDTPPGAEKEQFNKATISGNVTKNHSKLKIQNFSQKAVGEYKCKISFPGTSETKSSTVQLLLVKETKTPVHFNKDDEKVTLSCKLELGGDGGKIEKVEWLKNDTLVTELDEKERFKVEEDHSLVISKPMRADADMYIARFTVTNMIKAYDCHVEFTASPLVLDFDKSKNLIQEDNLELKCQVKGYPRVPIVWLKDGNPLNNTEENERIHLSSLNGYKDAFLKIDSVEFDDEGEYTCEAVSEQFNVTSGKSVTVRVKDKLAALWPFLGIVAEVAVLCTIIFIYEKRRNKRAEQEASTSQEVDGSATNKKQGLRYRNTQSNNPTA